MPSHDRDSSPDYASRPSEERTRAKEKVRGGTRKIVGDPDGQKPSEVDNLHIDFGQTLRLTPESKEPSTSRPSTAAGRRSPFDALGRPGSASGRRSPFDSLGPSPDRKSPLNTLESSSPARTPERQSSADRPGHSRSQSYAWQPGIQLTDGKDGLSAEEFVQQRAAMAMIPQGYIPHRTLSSSRLEQIKHDQPSSRPSTPNSPRRLQKRMPSSRQPSVQSVDYAAHLSAREQEHVAKMTGGPLLSNINQQRTPDPNVGLVGAIEAREQERRDIKEGLQGRMVQAAIDQRQREARNSVLQQSQADQRRQSQYMMQQQQQQYPNQYQQYPAGNDYSGQMQQAYYGPMQQQQQQQQRNVQPYQQSMYGMQSAQIQQMPMRETSQRGYPPQAMHQRSQSSYSQYSGFYGPQGR